MGLAMGGLSISKNNAEVIEVEKIVYVDRPVSSPFSMGNVGFVSTASSIYEEVKET